MRIVQQKCFLPAQSCLHLVRESENRHFNPKRLYYGVLPVKWTVQIFKGFQRKGCRAKAAYFPLCCKLLLMVLHRCQNTQLALRTFISVIVHIVIDRCYHVFPWVGLLRVVHLSLHKAPEAFHRPIICTMCGPGHALRHSCRDQSIVEFFWRILISPVTMKNRVGIRIGSAGIIKSIKDQLIVIMITDYIGHRPVVTEI